MEKSLDSAAALTFPSSSIYGSDRTLAANPVASAGRRIGILVGELFLRAGDFAGGKRARTWQSKQVFQLCGVKSADGGIGSGERILMLQELRRTAEEEWRQ